MAESEWEMIAGNTMRLLWFVDGEGAMQIFVEICAADASPEHIDGHLQASAFSIGMTVVVEGRCCRTSFAFGAGGSGTVSIRMSLGP